MRIIKLFIAAIILAAITSACSTIEQATGTGASSKDSGAAYAYNAESQTLTVEFPRGTYSYAGVPADVYSQIEKSESKGAVYNSLVKGKYPETKVK